MAVDVVSPGAEFEALGSVWALAWITPGHRAAFSRWCKRRAYADLAEARTYLPQGEYREKAERLDEAMAAGSYTWGSPLDDAAAGPGLAALFRTAEGQAVLAQMLLSKAHGDLDLKKVAEISEAGGDGYVRAMKEATDPNRNRPAANQNGATGDHSEQPASGSPQSGAA